MENEFVKERARLGNRSSKIIGGYVTENLFVEQFVSKPIEYTNSWWYSKTPDGRKFWFVEKEDISELDLKISYRLSAIGQECYQLYLKENEWNIVHFVTGDEWTIESFVNDQKLQARDKKVGKLDDSEDEITQMKRCIEYYKKKNILEDIERSISIEDSFLNKYFYTSNVDLFLGVKTENDMIPICLEIKFKDEFYINEEPCFGLDRYQLDEEYSLLERAGMKIFNVVLYNDKRDKSRKTTTNVFDYLTQTNNFQWKYFRVSRLVEYQEYRMHSNKTSFDGVPMKQRTVYSVPMELYESLTDVKQILNNDKLLDREGNEVDYNKENDKRCPLCDQDLVERNGKKGKFMSCSGYPKCKYTRSIK